MCGFREETRFDFSKSWEAYYAQVPKFRFVLFHICSFERSQRAVLTL
jgi:hypothetical protein